MRPLSVAKTVRLHVATFITCMSVQPHSFFKDVRQRNCTITSISFLMPMELRYRRIELSDSLHVCLPAFRLPVNDLHSPSVNGWWKEDDDTADIMAAAVSSQDYTALINSIDHCSVIRPTSHSSQCCSTRPITSCASIAAVGTSSRIFSLRPFSSSTSPVMAATSISSSVKSECNGLHTPSYYLNKLATVARNNAAHLDKFGRG